MPRRRLDGQRLVALALAGWLCFNYPVVAVFERLGWIGDWPALFVWLMASWLGLIAALAWTVGGARERSEP